MNMQRMSLRRKRGLVSSFKWDFMKINIRKIYFIRKSKFLQEKYRKEI